MRWFQSLIRRYQRSDPAKVDAAIALLFIAWIVLEALLVTTDGQSRAVTAVAGSAVMAVIAVRRRWPLAAALAFGALGAIQPTLGSFFLGSHTNASFVACIFMAYSTGRWLPRPTAWYAGLALMGLIDAGVVTSVTYEGVADILWGGVLFASPVLAGQAIRSRVALRRELREKAERLEADRELNAKRAVEEERDRIASELQAVVASGVTAMVVQAQAIPTLLAADDTARAAYAFEVIEETGRDALAEMRRLLGVLRREGDSAELAPQPGLAQLDALIDRYRAEGFAVSARSEGERRALPQGIDLTAFRVVQAALESATGDGATQMDILVRYDPREIELLIRDDRTRGNEETLRSARERVNLYGGYLRVTRDETARSNLFEARIPVSGSVGAPAPVGGAA